MKIYCSRDTSIESILNKMLGKDIWARIEYNQSSSNIRYIRFYWIRVLQKVGDIYKGYREDSYTVYNACGDSECITSFLTDIDPKRIVRIFTNHFYTTEELADESRVWFTDEV